MYGGSAGLWIAATLLGSLYIRQSLVSSWHTPAVGLGPSNAGKLCCGLCC